MESVSAQMVAAAKLPVLNPGEFELWKSKQLSLMCELKEEVCVSQPEGFVDQDNPSHVCKLKKALYGLNIAPLHEKSKMDKDLQGKQVDATLYYGMIGSLMYLTSSRPNLIYAVCLCARYQEKPTKKHLLAHMQMQTTRAKHIDVRYHFIMKQVENGIVELYFVWTKYQQADIFTKPLPRERFNFLIEKLDSKWTKGRDSNSLWKSLEISLRSALQGQDFDALPTDEEIVSFLRDLSHTREIHSLNDVVVDQMHQPWRTFAALINRSLSGKTSGLDKLRLSRA
ncbi:retrovirus-related pol polyprotein from transposon TNT 1-94 [Tanacetum coccineum]